MYGRRWVTQTSLDLNKSQAWKLSLNWTFWTTVFEWEGCTYGQVFHQGYHIWLGPKWSPTRLPEQPCAQPHTNHVNNWAPEAILGNLKVQTSLTFNSRRTGVPETGVPKKDVKGWFRPIFCLIAHQTWSKTIWQSFHQAERWLLLKTPERWHAIQTFFTKSWIWDTSRMFQQMKWTTSEEEVKLTPSSLCSRRVKHDYKT